MQAEKAYSEEQEQAVDSEVAEDGTEGNDTAAEGNAAEGSAAAASAETPQA